ncbi:hypothetical protein DFP87_12351 [Achromobacter marplatensis]|uniref:Uncharacterized protein n=1 Tax=Achromobacter marplatensis TaxID=470868 RepID=A0ABX9FWC2_9BURK|nr:hypothetical protein DFP87_12351 [Achromobacter marplatensis]CAB3711907.1 hypothetical protein LMG26219_05973 [Achromobacter marplatensis]
MATKNNDYRPGKGEESNESWSNENHRDRPTPNRDHGRSIANDSNPPNIEMVQPRRSGGGSNGGNGNGK